jgi:hypothetical protein
MRVRNIRLPVAIFVVVVMLAATGMWAGVRANQQDATPTTTTGQSTPVAPATGATPSAATQIVTLVLWYEQDPNGGPLQLSPIKTNDNAVATIGELTDRSLTGTAEFDEPKNNGQPQIVLGESVFNAYPYDRSDATTLYRWVYFNGKDGQRPATLVLQINAAKGPYKGYKGTATFVSRASNSGGVLVIVLYPPKS